MWGQAFEIVVRNDVATEGQRMREDWNCLDTIDIILAYFKKRYHVQED
jgi:hypothetical protein